MTTMAKKNEFKPDKPRAGLLSKLYITKKQREKILKWLLYSLVLLGFSLLQDVILCQIHLFRATTDLVPMGIFLVCVLEGMDGSCVFAIIAACIYQFSGAGPGYYSILLIVAAGMLVSFFRQSFLQKSFGATMLCTVVAVVLYELTVFFVSLFMGLTVWGNLVIAALTCLLTLLAAPVIYPAMNLIGTIGGETWKE